MNILRLRVNATKWKRLLPFKHLKYAHYKSSYWEHRCHHKENDDAQKDLALGKEDPKDVSNVGAVLWMPPWSKLDVATTTIQVQCLMVIFVYGGPQLFSSVLAFTPLSPLSQPLLNLLSEATFLFGTYLCLDSVSNPYKPLPSPLLKIQFSSESILKGFCTGMLLYIASDLCTFTLQQGSAESSIQMKDLFTNSNPVDRTLLLINSLIIAPFAEEYFFRGFLVPALNRWANIYFAILDSAVLFATMHFEAGEFILLTLLGSCFGLSLTLSKGNLLVSVVAHSTYNSIVVLSILAIG